MTKGPAAGPWGDPIRYVNRGGKGSFERSINVQRTYYLHVGQVNASLPEPFRGTSWFAYGAPDTSYLTPLWPIMMELPASLGRGDRYGAFDRESGFWTNIYVQQMAELHYNEAIKQVRAAREPRLRMLYEVTPAILEMAARAYPKDPEGAINLLTQFGYTNAVAWQRDWLALGDTLLAKYHGNGGRPHGRLPGGGGSSVRRWCGACGRRAAAARRVGRGDSAGGVAGSRPRPFA
jgi:dipeptidase